MSTIRSCSHCGKALTDAVSLTIGVGPVCRGIMNEVLANQMPVNVAGVMGLVPQLMMGLGSAAAETIEVLTEIAQGLLATAAAGDQRENVKRLDWACSYAQPLTVRTLLLDLMRALGYVGLAEIVSGKASTSEAAVALVGTKIEVKGAKNSAATWAFKKLQGWGFSTTTKTWSFPAAQLPAVVKAVQTYYPATKLDVAALTAAVAALPAPAVVVAPPAVKVTAPVTATPTATGVTLTDSKTAGWIEVRTPYKPAFIADIKTLPWKDRKWDGAAKCWMVTTAHETAVLALIAKHFAAASKAA